MSDTPSSDPTVSVESPAPKTVVSRKRKSTVVNPFMWGTGRRKAAVARVRIKPGDGKFTINKREVGAVFGRARVRGVGRRPLGVTDTGKSCDVLVNGGGGGSRGQAGAVALGLSRALVKASADSEPKLREQNLLTRDARRVERKKYGRRGARRSFQFSKR